LAQSESKSKARESRARNMVAPYLIGHDPGTKPH